jgi:hypothetical protein
MAALETNLAWIALVALAFAAGALLARLRTQCPVCGWTRHLGPPTAFEFRGVVSVRPTPQKFWAVRVLGSEPILLYTRTAALEYAIRGLIDSWYPAQRSTASAGLAKTVSN